MNDNQEFVIDEEHKDISDPYPTTAKKQEIIRKLDAMKTPKSITKLKHDYRELTSLSTVYNWRKVISEHGNKFF